MSRMLMAMLAGLVLCVTLGGCEQSEPEDESMTQRREAPAEKRAAPGSALGLSSETDETSDDPPAEEGGGG